MINTQASLLRILDLPTTHKMVHESIFRSWAILDYAEYLLEQGTPPQVVLGIIRELRMAPPKEQPPE